MVILEKVKIIGRDKKLEILIANIFRGLFMYKILSKCIDFRVRGMERERERHTLIFLFHLVMHSLVDSCICPCNGLLR